MGGVFTSDGATLPKSFRLFIEVFYKKWVIKRIDRAGVFHDRLTHNYPHSVRNNRFRFVLLLKRFAVPVELVVMINLGLWIFDGMPLFIQRFLQRRARGG